MLNQDKPTAWESLLSSLLYTICSIRNVDTIVNIYIVGHRVPDVDSIVSSFLAAELISWALHIATTQLKLPENWRVTAIRLAELDKITERVCSEVLELPTLKLLATSDFASSLVCTFIAINTQVNLAFSLRFC